MTVTTSEQDNRLDWKARIGWTIAGLALVLAICLSLFDSGSLGLWGLLPIIIYAALALLELNILLSTFVAMVAAIALAGLDVIETGEVMSESVGSFITVVGVIIMLGAGLGAIANATGAAQTLVSAVMRIAGTRSVVRTQVGVMVASMLIVGSLGTLAGGNSIIAPLVIPIAASVSLSRPATAVTLHTAGAAGLILGPFTPPVVTIMGAADISYTQYLFGAALPLAAVFVIVGFTMARVLNARTQDEAYGEEDLTHLQSNDQPAHSGAAAAAFLVTIVAMTIIGVIIEAGYQYAIIVMLVTAVTTSIAGRLNPTHAVTAFCQGAGSLLWLFFMFWFFDVILVLVEKSGAYEVLLDSLSPMMEDAGPWPFLMLTLVIGWIGIAGAAVAQVVLIDKLFWPLASSLGIPPIAWAASLLGGSQIDWFGPFPNGDMVGQMGIARSQNLRAMLIAGWTVMSVSMVVLAVLFWVLL